MLSFMIILQIILGLILIGIILIQKGKGAEMGVSFGAGAADTLFGPTGTMSLLAKVTWVIAFVFMLNSVGISYIIYESSTSSMISNVPQKQTQTPQKPVELPTKAKPITK